LRLVQILRSYFANAKPKPGVSKQQAPHAVQNTRLNIASPVLVQAAMKLETAAILLVTPTPKSIREAGALLEEANMWLRRESLGNGGDELASDIAEVQRGIRRVRHLLEGALRVQWIQIRQAAAVTQVYMPGGRIAPPGRGIASVDVNG
jgi:hypothetical protein